jgi:hypothetical protein
MTPVPSPNNLGSCMLDRERKKRRAGLVADPNRWTTARTGRLYVAQVKPPDPQLAAGAELREPVSTFTEPNLRSAFFDPHSGHSGDRPSE